MDKNNFQEEVKNMSPEEIIKHFEDNYALQYICGYLDDNGNEV